MTFNSTSSAIGASNNSFVSGPANKIGNTAFDFPTGKMSDFQPISISAPSNNTAAYTAEYFHANAALGTAKDLTIDSVSTCEYWTLNNVGTAYPVNISFGWNSQSCLIASGTGNMRLTEWNGNKWIDLGNDTNISGLVTSLASINTFGTFTLAQKKIWILGWAKYFALLSADSILSSDTTLVSGYAGATYFVSNKIKVLGGITFIGTPIVTNAISDLYNTMTYYSALSGTSISGSLNGQSLVQGIYQINGTATLNGVMSLTGDSSSIYIFNVTDSLIVLPNSFLDKGNVRSENIYWNVTKSAVLSKWINFPGIIMAGQQSRTELHNSGRATLLCLQKILISATNFILGENYFVSQYNLSLIPLAPASVCTSTGCNLICNPSFEQSNPSACLGNPGGISNGDCPFWFNATPGSPDYYNVCGLGQTPPFGTWIPDNFFGSQTCNSLCPTLNAYAGAECFCCYSRI